MDLRKFKKIRRVFHRFDGIFYDNTVLIAGLGIPFAVVATTTMQNAAALSIAMVCICVPLFVLSSLVGLTGKRIPVWLGTVFCSLLAALLLLPARTLAAGLHPTIFDSLGIYFSLMSVSSMAVFMPQSRRIAREKPWYALLDGICYSLGFALAVFLISFFREWLSKGTVWGIPVSIPYKFSGMAAPFGGFLAAGFCGAGFQLLNRGTDWLFRKRRRSRKREGGIR